VCINFDLCEECSNKDIKISKSPLNHSKSKQLYSFSKSERFPKLKDSGFSSTYFYNLPDVRTMRAASIGKGDKYDFTKENKDKNPNIYNSKSDFDTKAPHSPQWTFGLSRECFEKVYYETNKTIDKNVPGPGKYDYLKPFGNDANKFSIRGKGDHKGLSASSKVPGPGEYPILSMNPTGKYPYSNVKNATNIVWGSSKSPRFNYNLNNFPGPEKYEQKPLINGKGILFVSKFQSSPGKSMTGKFHEFHDKFPTPGPGSYKTSSEFGIYESKSAHLETKEK